MPDFIPMTRELYDTILSVSLREPEIFAELGTETAKMARTGGLIVFDNTLFGGRVAPSFDVATMEREEFRNNVIGARMINEFLLGDERVTLSLVYIADGITICRKR